MPSGAQAQTALNLTELSGLMQMPELRERAARSSGAGWAVRPEGAPDLLLALDALLGAPVTVAVAQPPGTALGAGPKAELQSALPAGGVLAAGDAADAAAVPLLTGKSARRERLTYYVCRGRQCELPTTELKTALREIRRGR